MKSYETWFVCMVYRIARPFIIPPPQNGVRGYTGFALSRPSVRPSVRLQFVSALFLYLWKDFLQTWMTHSTQPVDVQSQRCPCVSSRLRSQLKVKYLTNKYYTLSRVRSITPLLMEGFPSNFNDTFSPTRGCAEPMLPKCQIKVKVTGKCQIFNKQILHIMLCPLYNSFTNGRISFKLEWHIHLN